MAHGSIHVLRHHEAFDFCNSPFQVIQRLGSDCYQNAGIEKVLIVCKALLKVVAGLDGSFDVIKVGIGIRCILDAASIDTKLLSKLCLNTILGLTLEVEIHVYAFTGIYQKRCPPGHHTAVVSIGGDYQIGVVDAIHDGVRAM